MFRSLKKVKRRIRCRIRHGRICPHVAGFHD